MNYTPVRAAVLLSTLISCFILSDHSVSAAQAQEQPNYTLRELELSQKEQRNTYSQVQDRVVEKMSSFLNGISSGSTIPVITFDQFETEYLAAVYLYCTLQKGTCQFFLDALLETDLVRSVEQSKISCPNLKGIWKQWVAANMERRLEHGLSIGFFAAAQEFRKSERPKYIKCENTIEQLLKKTPESSGLASRYQPGTEPRKAVETTAALIEEIRQKIPNIYARAGVA